MSEYSKLADERDQAWKRFTDYLDGIWRGKHQLDAAKYKELHDKFAEAMKKVDDLWKKKPGDAFKV